MKNLKNLWYSEFSVVLLAILASGILGLIFGFLFEFLFFGCLLLVFVYFLQFGLIVYDASTEVGLDRKLFYLTPFARRWFTIVRNNRNLVNRLELSVARYKGRVAKRKLRMATAVRGFRDSLSVMSDAIVLVDRQNRIDWWNPAASELLGLSRSIDRNKPLKSLFNGEEFEKFVSNYEDDDSIELRSPTSEDALL
ncbi:PAS domain-containing protein [Myxococcota bacterium]|nr:PAS domain-containing protein [Myxococcota bacterium]